MKLSENPPKGSGDMERTRCVTGGMTDGLTEEGHSYNHTGQCKRTGGFYNELVVAFFSTGGGVKGKSA